MVKDAYKFALPPLIVGALMHRFGAGEDAATGFAALENAIESIVKRKKVVILAGPLPRPQDIFEKARLGSKHGKMLQITADLPSALKLAREMEPPPPSTRAPTAATAHRN